ncbi:hypothetical protein HDU76_011902, partial [Blyttiomyces sp. JEL0837]
SVGTDDCNGESDYEPSDFSSKTAVVIRKATPLRRTTRSISAAAEPETNLERAESKAVRDLLVKNRGLKEENKQLRVTSQHLLQEILEKGKKIAEFECQ